jgi:hypothetical protein
VILPIAFPCSSLMLLHVATVPLPQSTMEAGVVEHHTSAVRAIGASAPQLRWQGALSHRAGGRFEVDSPD